MSLRCRRKQAAGGDPSPISASAPPPARVVIPSGDGTVNEDLWCGSRSRARHLRASASFSLPGRRGPGSARTEFGAKVVAPAEIGADPHLARPTLSFDHKDRTVSPPASLLHHARSRAVTGRSPSRYRIARVWRNSSRERSGLGGIQSSNRTKVWVVPSGGPVTMTRAFTR